MRVVFLGDRSPVWYINITTLPDPTGRPCDKLHGLDGGNSQPSNDGRTHGRQRPGAQRRCKMQTSVSNRLLCALLLLVACRSCEWVRASDLSGGPRLLILERGRGLAWLQ